MSCNTDNSLAVTRLKCQGNAPGKCVDQQITFERVTYTAGYCQPRDLQCIDSDGGNNITSAGTTTRIVNADGGRKSKKDKCLDNKRLEEHFCSGISINSTIVVCTDVCRKGACVDRSTLCTDTDGGQNFTGRGTVTTGFASVNDFCINGKILLEFGCTAANGEGFAASSKKFHAIHLKRHNCPKHCYLGACVAALPAA
jgi:hypothetical protein